MNERIVQKIKEKIKVKVKESQVIEREKYIEVTWTSQIVLS